MKVKAPKFYTTGAVCRALGLPMHKYCYLENAGRIPAARRTGRSGKRIFTAEDIQRLKVILRQLRAEARQ